MARRQQQANKPGHKASQQDLKQKQIDANRKLSGPHRLDKNSGGAPGYAIHVFVRSARVDGNNCPLTARANARYVQAHSFGLRGVKVAPHLHHNAWAHARRNKRAFVSTSAL